MLGKLAYSMYGDHENAPVAVFVKLAKTMSLVTPIYFMMLLPAIVVMTSGFDIVMFFSFGM